MRRSPLRDVSNSRTKTSNRTRHKLFPQKFSQVLDETIDPTQSLPVKVVGHIENVHVTLKKTVPTKSKTLRKTKSKTETVTNEVTKEDCENNSPIGTKSKKSKSTNIVSETESITCDVTEGDKENNPTTTTQKKVKAKRPTRSSRRRTSFDFLPPPKFSQSSLSSSSTQGRTKLGGHIALTSCDKEDKDLVKQLVKQLGVYGYHDTITEKTTHVVTGSGKRTINLIKGMVLGCWIVTRDWLVNSLELGAWSQEEQYELTSFSSAVRDVREQRQVYRQAFKSSLFSGLRYFIF